MTSYRTQSRVDAGRRELGARISNRHVPSKDREGDNSPTSDVPASIELQVVLSVLTVGDTEQIVATVRNAAGTILSGVQPTGWVSANPAIVSVDGFGRITALGAGGPVLITATLSTLSTSTPITVAAGPDLVAASVAVTPTTVSIASGTSQLAAVIKNAGGAVLALSPTSWTSSTPAVATVSVAGLVTFVGVGTTNVQAHYNAIVSNTCVVTGVAGGGGGGAGVNFAKHDFEDGTLGPFWNPWKIGIDVFAGTIGGRTGNFCRIHYTLDGVVQVDDNKALFPITPIVRRLGDHIWFQGDFYVDNTVDAMRKLTYWSALSFPESSAHVEECEPGFGAGTNLLEAITRVDATHDSLGFAFVPTKTWHTIKIHLQFESAFGAGNGVLQVWVDTVLGYNRSNMSFTGAGWTEDPATFNWDSFGVGYQAQSFPAGGATAVDEYRYWDNVSYADKETAL